MRSQAFFLPSASRPKDYPRLTKALGKFWHTGIIHRDKVYECFDQGKHSAVSYSDDKKKQLTAMRAVFVDIKIDEAKLKNELTAGTSCAEYVARVVGMSRSVGAVKRYRPEQVYSWTKSRAEKPHGKLVKVNDKIQHGFTYRLTEPVGKHFDKEFKPELTPKQMLELGVFGGRYMTDCRKEFPVTWFSKAKLNPDRHDPKINFFKVNASQPLKVWRDKGWIYPDDPRGWFQWYCRYYMGRRIEGEDERQIKRWRAMRRHIAQIKNNCRPGDLDCRRKQRQALLHWAYDSRKY